jgi:hypothetical protein
MLQVKIDVEQLSEMVGAGVAYEALHVVVDVFKLAFPGQLMVGATLSVTVTLKLQVTMFPAASRAV